ncbi:MAG TPA: ABC transporter permease, partial [Vicinamibacterales bacterium]
MRHPLNWLARVGRSRSDRLALLGDLEQEYQLRVRPRRPWFAAQTWYLRELLVAFVCALKDGVRLRRLFFFSDIRLALRRWRRRPGFAAAAVLTLALGIGATTAIFSVVDAVLLRPLPWTDPDELVVIHGVYPDRAQNPATAATWNRALLSFPMWDALRALGTFETVGVWRPEPRADTTFGDDRTAIVRTMDASSNLFPMLGVRLVHGRYFTDEEDNKPTPSVLITYETWQTRFNARPDIVGHPATLGSASSTGRYPKTVVGVLAPGFKLDGPAPEFILPVGIYAETARTYPAGYFRTIARLGRGVGIGQAEAAATATVRAVDTREAPSARLVPIDVEQLGAASRPLWLLFAAAGLLLLVACSNVAGLLLGESRHRRHEIAVRTAVGASRFRLARQLVVEHALLAGVGAAAGLALAGGFTRSLVALAPEGFPRLDAVAVDLRVALFGLGLGCATLMLFGLGPALSLARTPAAKVLAEGGRDGGSHRHFGQRAIVAAQICLALVLLVAASLFGETLLRLTSQPLGFKPERLAIVTTTFTGPRFGDARALRAAQGSPHFREVLQRQLLESGTSLNARAVERLEALPGIIAAGGATSLPFTASPSIIQVRMEGRPAGEVHRAHRQIVTDRYFDTLGIPILSGRGFAPTDRAGASVVVVSREFERRVVGASALDQRIVHEIEGVKPAIYQVIGVAGDVKQREFTDDYQPIIYGLDRQAGLVSHFIARTSTDPAAMLPLVRTALADVTPQLVVTAMTTG